MEILKDHSENHYILNIYWFSYQDKTNADDTQLYVAESPDDTGPVCALFRCILDTGDWLIAQPG